MVKNVKEKILKIVIFYIHIIIVINVIIIA